MRCDLERAVARLLERGRAERREVLFETECGGLLEALGIRTPRSIVVGGSEDPAVEQLASLAGERVVLKVLSREILHKSDVGGVAMVPKEPSLVVSAIRDMERRFDGLQIAGFAIQEFVPHERGLGDELLLGARRSEDFGPLVTFGAGGVNVEFLAQSFRPGRDVAVLSPWLVDDEAAAERVLRRSAMTRLVIGDVRRQPARIGLHDLTGLVRRMLEATRLADWEHVAEFEVNPLVPTAEGPVALDALLRLAPAPRLGEPDRPLHKLRHLLQPRTLAIIGVSQAINPGRLILRNVLREGFDPARLYVIKAGVERVDGCACYPDLESLPEPVDLLVLSIDAAQVPATVERAVALRRAESLIIIPGGLDEREGGEQQLQPMREALRAARGTRWGGPLINGGNCLGIRSLPGRYDTTFIPDFKRARASGTADPIALISQSGAFLLARLDKLGGMNPAYQVSLGNQFDLTFGDYLTHLQDDERIELFACYVEGFREGDGLRWLRAAREISRRGRTVLLYRAGRTPQGARATASHTAVVAGDYEVTRQLARQAGVVVADSLADFEDLLMLFHGLRGLRPAGRRLAALSNAGFECVAFADRLHGLQLAEPGGETARALRGLFRDRGLERILEVRNPLDLSPMMDDAGFARAVELLLGDAGVDLGVVGCVPMTPALNSLAAGDLHEEDLLREDSVAQQLVRVKRRSGKPWVVVIDGGELYDPFARALRRAGIPTFRTADRALRLLAAWSRARLAAPDR